MELSLSQFLNVFIWTKFKSLFIIIYINFRSKDLRRTTKQLNSFILSCTLIARTFLLIIIPSILYLIRSLLMHLLNIVLQHKNIVIDIFFQKELILLFLIVFFRIILEFIKADNITLRIYIIIGR